MGQPFFGSPNSKETDFSILEVGRKRGRPGESGQISAACLVSLTPSQNAERQAPQTNLMNTLKPIHAEFIVQQQHQEHILLNKGSSFFPRPHNWLLYGLHGIVREVGNFNSEVDSEWFCLVVPFADKCQPYHFEWRIGLVTGHFGHRGQQWRFLDCLKHLCIREI